MANPQRENGYVAIANEIMEALGRTRIPGEARQMLDVIIRKTYGFNKREDRISTSQFLEFTGLSRRSIYKARRKLKGMNLITISKKGDSQYLIYSFQKDYDKWKVSPKKETVSQKGEGYLQKRSQTVSQKAIHKRHKVDSQKTLSETKVAFNAYKDAYKQNIGKEYIPSYEQDNSILKDLLEYIPLEELKLLIQRFFTSKDSFITNSDYGSRVFRSQILKLRKEEPKPFRRQL